MLIAQFEIFMSAEASLNGLQVAMIRLRVERVSGRPSFTNKM